MIPTSDVMQRWLLSGMTARISGLDFIPVAHPLAPNTVSSITKGQACVYLIRQIPQETIWFLKEFAPSRRPDDRYLLEVARHVPGHLEFISCTQRRLLAREHVDRHHSDFRDPGLADFLDGCILTPKVPGESWVNRADELRSSRKSWCLQDRLRAALGLARAVERLEAGGCSHRDLSGGNVFIQPDGNIHLIDWDSLFHRNIEFQANTTVGTAGYMAPFTRSPTGGWDARLSWQPWADRFALGILIAEFLLTDSTTPAQEDGSLFSQAQLNDTASAAVRQQVHRIEDISIHLAWQLLAMFQATAFEKCPSPRHWMGALHHALHTEGAVLPAPRVTVNCDACQTAFTIPPTVHDQIRRRQRPILCRPCRARKTNGSAPTNGRPPGQYEPRIRLFCEHCHGWLTKSRNVADDLRERGKPLLCGGCLEAQRQAWDEEGRRQDFLYPETSCSQCGAVFRMSREKLDGLKTLGRRVLCRTCFQASPFAVRVRNFNLRIPTLPRFFR